MVAHPARPTDFIMRSTSSYAVLILLWTASLASAADPLTFEQTLKGTLTAGFHMSQLVARRMVAAGNGGKIVFISSVQSRIPYVRSVAYNAAKAGLNCW